MGSPIFEHAAAEWSRMRAEFELVVQAAYEAAEVATNARFLNRRGMAAGIDSYSLMTGPFARVEAFASAELVEHFEHVGRPSLERFEREWLAARTEWTDESGSLTPAQWDTWLSQWENTTTNAPGRAA
ncbi:hypothetical protein [Myceligenerans salitolerans]|uniref:DUF222 domain-containing protein n=1 Tax=Myceligenerans salitolerans TaxID=1230528 RepID=A0ABS3IAH9_9MICO|nr:hypothetical protein [Myceligenerans salitolerans]MBO0609374.1 hypothetical protein [Myceligenerans salitolerans]